MDILDILKKAAESQAADIFIVCGCIGLFAYILLFDRSRKKGEAA